MKRWKSVMLGAALSIMMSTTAFAGQWVQDGTGWWYDNGNGTWPASTWQWIDGDGDGLAECYYFDENGYMASDTRVSTRDINADGAWEIDGIAQTREVGLQSNIVYDTVNVFRSADDQTIVFRWREDPMNVGIFGYGEEGWYAVTRDLYWAEENMSAMSGIFGYNGDLIGWYQFTFLDGNMHVDTYNVDGSISGSFLDGEYWEIPLEEWSN